MRFAPHPFTVRQLQYAVAVADELSFRRAAERCAVSQPSLSAQIAELEGCLGVRLFERDRRGVLLTPAGETLIASSRRALLQFEHVIETAAGVVDPLAGTLRLGVIPTIAAYMLPTLDPALRSAFERLSLVWREDQTDELVRRIDSGEIDAAVLAANTDLGDLEVANVGKDPFVVAMAAEHPLAGGRRGLRAADLSDQPLLLLEDGHCLHEQAMDLCGAGGRHELGFRATSLGTLCQMVGAGLGITLLPQIAVASETRTGRIVTRRFTRPVPYRELVLAWRRGTARADAFRKVSAVAAKVFAALPGDPRR